MPGLYGSKPLDELLQCRLHGFGDLRGQGIHLGRETPDHRSILTDQKFIEVPVSVPTLITLIGDHRMNI
ncbi:MAG: hypothetical protein ACYSOY_08945, partial [Planctomycetota bacterium]